ncbi:cytochrome b [Trinickia dinghuensis]|uniref:Cytochrome b n=1 Tax=Trinickia dinghuensis TaxID=2291023 RepID=A0A3D8JTW0_9BURK|nr:cytochrome b/b6 domain-containing protein [Trinickia dinghuensis]RDU95831.1 cytochrome b [Trinickia dinghuensis]
MKPSIIRYGAVAQLFHWVTAVLVLVAFIYGPGGPEARVYSAASDMGRRIHETLGLCVFTLAILRLLWRAIDKQPDAEPASPWMKAAATVVQWVLILLLLALPMTAITGAWLEGHPLTLVAGIDVAPLFPDAKAAGAIVASIHGWLGDIIMWVAGCHALAALFHHFVLKDGVLESMLPHWLIPKRARSGR